ncbi:hypothetical protein COL93_27125 [Bacillus toyonensis]|uniref:Uncharacterized protein n=1 Tax=Bacillus toyonensis TaxID=155322 RepID=A0A2B5X6W4_9BACI|nr:hypothetical protein COL93_27125 [Bacillus toyonensis]PHD67957.1 hypothetical protein COF40_18490 [Bacillus toyonensis]
MGLFVQQHHTFVTAYINLVDNMSYQKHPVCLKHAGCFLVFVFHNKCSSQKNVGFEGSIELYPESWTFLSIHDSR